MGALQVHGISKMDDSTLLSKNRDRLDFAAPREPGDFENSVSSCWHIACFTNLQTMFFIEKFQQKYQQITGFHT